MSLAGRRVLVTGAGGFIGSHLAERLAAEGCHVRALLRYSSTGSRGWLEDSAADSGMEVLLGDVADRDCVRSAVEGMDTVFHLAALIGIPYSYEAPQAYVRTNVEGTVNVLQAARLADVRRIVHTSTSETYGTSRRVPIDEDHPLQGQSPYSASKIAADKLAESFFRSFGTPVATVRPFNTYGPRQSARAIIPTIIAQALAGGPVRLGSLHPTRDLTFVDDTVTGFISAASADDAVGRTVNLGSGREISIGDLARSIIDRIDPSIEIVTHADRVRPPLSEVERLIADNRLAADLLGWSPSVMLDEGLDRTIAWFRGAGAGSVRRPETYHV